MKNQKGITLIALIITIIVMLILVGVSITVALNGGLFETAQDAVYKTKAERDNELAMSSNDIIEQYLPGTKQITWTHADANNNETFDVGEVVTASNGESFYVIATPRANDETVKLLALKCVDTRVEIDGEKNPNYNKQNDSYNYVAFDEGQWDEDGENCYKPGTTRPVTNVYEDASIKELVETYVTETLGLEANKGILMSETEASTLMSGHTDILYGTTTKWNYWLGSPDEQDTSNAWRVAGDDNEVELGGVGIGNLWGLRPVIEISLSDVD